MPPSALLAPVVALVGPTATGKSDLGVALAVALGGEVINADSMQLYRGMDIGTAKLGVAERRGVPHHLLDVLDVRETASVAVYQREARGVVADCVDRGVVPILAGGSGLYVRAVLDRFEFPGTDAAVRRRLEAELAERGSGALHERLARLDPAAASSILPTNGRRIVRALEVIELTGRPFTATLPPGSAEPAIDAVIIGLALPRPDLDARVTARVERMWERGLVDEVRSLADRGLREGRTASRALGYRQVLAYLDGAATEAEARAETVRATRKFARRQETWFRADPRVRWLAADASDLVELATRTIAA